MLQDVVSCYLPRINKEIERYLDDIIRKQRDELVKRYYMVIKDYILAGGKRWRPISFVMAYRGVGGREEEEAVKTSISIEFLHNSSLAQDDIMDKSLIRRGKPALHVRYADEIGGGNQVLGEALGILGGDSLLELGLEVIVSSNFEIEAKMDAVSMYLYYYRRLIEGQTLDMSYPTISLMSEEQIVNMMRLKTSSLFICSLLMGARLGGCKSSVLNVLRKYGENVGIAFQIRDDILGVFGDPKITGKSVIDDLREGKKTLLLYKTLQLAQPSEKKFIKSRIGSDNISVEDVKRIRSIMVETGALNYVEAKAEMYVREGIKVLNTVPELTKEFVDFLKELAFKSVKRKL